MIKKQNLNKSFSFFQNLALCAALVILCSCKDEVKTDKTAEPPAKVSNAVKESELTSVKLSPQAEERLGNQTAAVENRKLARAIKLGGEVIAIPGKSAIITAPYTGRIVSPAGHAPLVGAPLRRGQEVFRLAVLPAGGDVIGARDEVEVKGAQFELAQAKAKRAEQLLQEKAVSEKAVEEARTELVTAEASYKAAQAKLRLLNNKSPDAGVDALSTMALTAPVEGVLQKVHVSIGQTVAAAAPVFEVSSQDPVWVRVPVYVGAVETIDTKSPARVELLGQAKESESRRANAVQGPPLSDANAASADLYYQMTNEDGHFRIGEKVTVTLTQKTEEEGLIVPISAILYDMEGGTWVYVKTAPQVYERRRIEVKHLVGDQALLARGPDPGKQVVIVGAAEIFGTEFGAGK